MLADLPRIIEIALTSEGEGYFDRSTVTSSAIESNKTTYEVNMSNTTDTEIGETRTLMGESVKLEAKIDTFNEQFDN